MTKRGSGSSSLGEAISDAFGQGILRGILNVFEVLIEYVLEKIFGPHSSTFFFRLAKVVVLIAIIFVLGKYFEHRVGGVANPHLGWGDSIVLLLLLTLAIVTLRSTIDLFIGRAWRE